MERRKKRVIVGSASRVIIRKTPLQAYEENRAVETQDYVLGDGRGLSNLLLHLFFRGGIKSVFLAIMSALSR